MSLLEKSNSIELSRRTQPFHAKKDSYSLGRQVQVEIDVQREYLDMETFRIVFDLEVVGGTTVTTNPWTASACIKSLRWKTLSGQMIGHEIIEYRGAYRFFKKMGMSNSDARTSEQDLQEGALGGYDITDKTRQYAHKPINHLGSIKDYYPAHFHQGLMLEFDLSDNAYEIFKWGGAPTPPTSVSFNNCRVLVDLVQVKPEIENEMVRLMEEQKLFVDYIEWLVYSAPLGTSDESMEVVGIDGRVKSSFAFNIAGRATDGSVDFWGDDVSGASAMGRNSLTSYRFRLGSNYLNYAPVKVDTQTLAEHSYELSKALDMHCDAQRGDSAKTFALTDTRLFGIGVKVDKAQCDVDEVLSSQVDKDRNNMRVELVKSGATASTGYVINVLDKRLQLLPGSIVRNVRS